ncbi:PTS glucitol/sorbitol transporter subunit IIA [Ornithinibacillus sp. 179-J 7C1 HS]|uniref:PTS glucitol/sorbitol transporter subunit IIA n=1 Tax=Ornithinibacillus sp. 179-J 7C1 HS TaxID=3142384 RepID=UPI0039A045A1
MTVIYESIITKIGSDVSDLMDENMLILFNDTVPEELETISVIHKQGPILGLVEKGDYLYFNGEGFEILYVGEKVNETLQELGHCTVKFSNEIGEELPGTICVEKRLVPTLAENMTVRFVKR